VIIYGRLRGLVEIIGKQCGKLVYHAGMPDAERTKSLQAFLASPSVITATGGLGKSPSCGDVIRWY